MAHDVTGRPHVAVVGAGFAGLSAAVKLIDAGCRVTVFERAPRGGGRAAVFVDRDTGERIDNGQHVLFGCYRETYAFLRRLGTADRAPLQASLSLAMAGPDGTLHTLTCPSIPSPWHLIVGAMRWRALSVGDRLSALRMGGVIRRARTQGAAAVARTVPGDITVSQWLDGMKQARGLRDWLWDPLTFAALNQSPDVAAAEPFVRVVGELFGPRPEDAAVGLATVPLDELYVNPAINAIENSGGAVHLRTEARLAIDMNGRAVGVRTADGIVEADAVVSAVPWFALDDLWPDGRPPAIAALAERASSMVSSPIVTVNLWFDGPVLPRPFVGFVQGPMQWAFDRQAIVGSAVHHLSVVASGAVELVRESNEEITARAVAQLSAALPAMQQRRVLRSVIVREHRASFSLAPGGPARPDQKTALPGFVLAGDWTNTGLPATIEGAVVSGHRAAEAVVRQFET
ncbi:MAG: hydroxysqualene dehydroxylase HpnE [Acidobacteriota bacterium]